MPRCGRGGGDELSPERRSLVATYTTLMNHDRLDVGRPAEIAEIIFGDARDIRFDITGRCREPASERRHRYQNW